MASNYALFLRQNKLFTLSYVQTDATTPNFVGPTMNNVGSCCITASSGVQTDASTPNNVGTCILGLGKEFIDPKTVWDTNMDAVLLFWDTSMVEVTSCKKAYGKVLLKSF